MVFGQPNHHAKVPVKRTSGNAKTKDVFGDLHKAPKMLRAALYARVSTLDQQTLACNWTPEELIG
jgi:hypothetical protein